MRPDTRRPHVRGRIGLLVVAGLSSDGDLSVCRRNSDDEATGLGVPGDPRRLTGSLQRASRAPGGSEGFAQVTSHVFRRTCATILDTAGQTPRAIADQLGHTHVSMTQNHHLGRGIADPSAAAVLDAWRDDEKSGEQVVA